MKPTLSAIPKSVLVIGFIAIIVCGILSAIFGYRMGKEMAIRDNDAKSTPIAR